MTKARDIANAGTALSSVDATELGYLDGVTSNIQTQFSNISGSKAQPTEPSSPTDGMIWVDTDGSTTDANFIPKTLTSTTGDIIYASSANTPARLGIGSTGNVLTVSGGIPAWGTATSGLNLITTQSFSASTSVVVNNCFTSTYTNYKIILNYNSSANAQTRLRLRVGGTSDSANSYSGNTVFFNNTTAYNEHNGSLTYFVFNNCDGTSTPTAYASIDVGSPNESKETAFAVYAEGSKSGNTNASPFIGGAIFEVTTVFDGFEIFPGSGNITGTVQVYGYGK